MATLSTAMIGSASAQQQPASGPGLLCLYGIAVSVRAWRDGCQPEIEADPAELNDLVEQFRDNVRRTLPDADTRIIDFETQMAGDFDPNLDCGETDVAAFGQALLADLSAFVEAAEPLIARTEPPEWGTCL